VEVRALIVQGLGWASLGALMLAVLGGLLARRTVLRRVETINRTATAIVQGDLSRRVPTQGSSDEFDQLVRTINAMLQQIEHLVEGVRNASNVVAHDLRTPLAELRTRLEALIRAHPPEYATYDEIHKAVDDIDRIINIFNALLRLAEIESGIRRSGFRTVDLTEVTTQVAELYGALAEEKGVTLTFQVSPGIQVLGDPNLIAQAVGNLLDNAIKFTPSQGKVSLRVAQSAEGLVEIEVSDNGPGIAKAERASVTKRFYRGDRRAAMEGTGLGLSLVDAVAHLHGGTLSLSDKSPGLAASLTLSGNASAIEPTCRS